MTPDERWPMLRDGGELHPNHHGTWSRWDRGPGAARAALRRLRRITRHQRERDAHVLGYRDLGGEG